MNVILCRHAERKQGHPLAEQNPGLSPRGHTQAQRLSEHVLAGGLPAPKKIWASPKRRAQETLDPLSKSLKIEIQVLAELDERQGQETKSDFDLRIKRILRDCERSTSSIIMVSHLDWIEEFLIQVPSDTNLLQTPFNSWATCQYMSFEVEGGLWKMKKFGEINAHS